MKHAFDYRRLLASCGLFGVTLALAACGGGGGGESNSAPNNPPPAIVAPTSSTSSQSSSVSSASFSSVNASTPATQNKPSMPTGLQPTAIYSTRVVLTWQESTSATPVTAYRLTRNGIVIGETDGPVTSYTDTGLNPENQYTYRVQGGDAQGNWSSLSMGLSIRTAPPGNDPELPPEKNEGSSSSTSSRSSSSRSSSPGSNIGGADVTAPSRPNGLAAINIKDTSIDLTWNAASDNLGVTLYRILRDGEQVGVVSGQSLAFLDLDLTANTEYNYTVQATDAAGNWSLASANLLVKTSPPPKEGSLLTWSHPTRRENGEYLELDDIGGYELRYRQNSLDSFKSIPVTGSRTTSYELKGLPSNYDYQIAVYDTHGLYSNYVAITPR